MFISAVGLPIISQSILSRFFINLPLSIFLYVPIAIFQEIVYLVFDRQLPVLFIWIILFFVFWCGFFAIRYFVEKYKILKVSIVSFFVLAVCIPVRPEEFLYRLLILNFISF
jgi:hypothetical protein